MSTPEVTIVVPSFNHARFAGETIASIAAQRFDDFELIVIDDGSEDDSVAVIKQALAAHQFRHEPVLIARENRGLPRTLNEGLARAAGRFFCYLGSDDMWERDKLLDQLEAWRLEPRAVAAFSDCWIIDERGEKLRRKSDDFEYHGGDIYVDLLQFNFFPPSPTNLFLTSEVREAGGFDEALAIEDLSLWVRLTRRGRVVYVPRPLASFRTHGANTSTRHPERTVESNRAVVEWAIANDPSLASIARILRRRLLAVTAATYYSALQLGPARRFALRAFLSNPGDRFALKVLLRSLLPAALVRRLRGK